MAEGKGIKSVEAVTFARHAGWEHVGMVTAGVRPLLLLALLPEHRAVLGSVRPCQVVLGALLPHVSINSDHQSAEHSRSFILQAWQPDAPNLLATGGKDGRVMVYDIRMYRDGMPKICFPVAMADPIDEVAHIVWSTGGFLYVAHISGRVSLRKVPVQLLTELRQLRVPPAAPGRQPPQHK